MSCQYLIKSWKATISFHFLWQASTEADCADLVECKNAKELLEKTVLED